MRISILHTGLMWTVCLLVALTGCSTPEIVYRILPPLYDYNSYMVPLEHTGTEAEYVVNPDGSITFDREGLRVTLRALGDKELNQLYPNVSNQDRFSANPFTYGNWRDPKLGYTPNRFTVFEVTVFNPVEPKVEMLPDEARMRSNLGEEFIFYSVNREESQNSFEDYYTYVRGAGGNEQYRFDQRMGIVRERLYRPDHQIFRGQDYEGYLVFGPLTERVDSVELHLRKFALEFDEANNPSRSIDIVFHFGHKVEKRKLEGDEARLARRRDWITGAR